jgi:signal transduction histidine kinase
MHLDPIRVLLVEDDRDQAELVRRSLERQDPPLDVRTVGDGLACLEHLEREPYSVVLLDYKLPRMNGIEVLGKMQERGIAVPVVMVTGQGDERVAVEAVKAGALDYVIKTRGYLTTLPTVIFKVLKQHELARENTRLYKEAQRALSELRAAQDQLIQGATLRALGELASGASHHLNNLLTVVLGRAESLLAKGVPPPMERQLQIIKEASMDAAEVIRRMQHFGRLRGTEHKPVDLRKEATMVLEMNRPRWQAEPRESGICIEASLDAEPVPLVMGNPAALREVITNLVLNAVDALPKGGHVTIRTFLADGWVHLSVADNGDGMSEEVRRRAPEPFFTTKGPQRTGLGLSVNYGIIKEHGGAMHIESAEGRGTTVTIRLPARSPIDSMDGASAAPAAASAIPSLRILVVDDEPKVREVLAEMLTVLGHTVFQAGGGGEAIEIIRSGQAVDLALIDVIMPDMKGWEVARAIKAHSRHTLIALVTGHTEAMHVPPEDRQAIAEMLVKPVTYHDLQKFLLCWRGEHENTGPTPSGTDRRK